MKLTSLRRKVHAGISLGQRRYRLLSWKFESSMRAALPRRISPGSHDIRTVENALPNSGAFPVDANALPSERVLAAVHEPERRQTGVEGFEGFALDDALAYSDEYKHFSFFREAKAIARIIDLEFGRRDVSVLELGCGGGDLRGFLRTLGVERYLGVDANPVAFNESPHIRPFQRHFRLLNLQQEIDFRRQFDVVFTFEVLEHIREDRLDPLMRTIRNHMGPDSLFLGTASLQEQYDVHVTVRPREFWLDRFAAHRLVPHPAAAIYERVLSENHPFNWDATNTNVFALHLADVMPR